MFLNRETEQQKRKTNITSDQMTSEYKAKGSTRSLINEWTKTLVTQLKAFKSRYAGSCQASTLFHGTVSCSSLTNITVLFMIFFNVSVQLRHIDRSICRIRSYTETFKIGLKTSILSKI